MQHAAGTQTYQLTKVLVDHANQQVRHSLPVRRAAFLYLLVASAAPATDLIVLDLYFRSPRLFQHHYP
jgi:hypothetical protein